jgi:hypothetical protein
VVLVPWPREPRGGSEYGTGGAGADGERVKGRGTPLVAAGLVLLVLAVVVVLLLLHVF